MKTIDDATLDALLDADRICVQQGFKARVMARLPVAEWEARSARAWWLPFAVMLVAGFAGSWLLATGGSLSGDNHLWATGVAILDFLQTGLLAGAGLLMASWRGFGMGLEELFAGSDASLLILALLVICLDLLVVFLLRRRPNAAVMRTGASQSEPDTGD